MALGADRSSVLADVMKEGLLLAGIGVVVGLAGAFGLNRLIAALLFGVQPTDVPTAGRRGRDDDDRGSGGLFAAGLAGVATRSERGAESIDALSCRNLVAGCNSLRRSQSLLTYCRLNNGRVHVVVVFNLTRFARDTPSPNGDDVQASKSEVSTTG